MLYRPYRHGPPACPCVRGGVKPNSYHGAFFEGGIFDFEEACGFFDLIGSRYNVFYMVSPLQVFLLDQCYKIFFNYDLVS